MQAGALGLAHSPAEGLAGALQTSAWLQYHVYGFQDIACVMIHGLLELWPVACSSNALLTCPPWPLPTPRAKAAGAAPASGAALLAVQVHRRRARGEPVGGAVSRTRGMIGGGYPRSALVGSVGTARAEVAASLSLLPLSMTYRAAVQIWCEEGLPPTRAQAPEFFSELKEVRAAERAGRGGGIARQRCGSAGYRRSHS